MTDEVDDAEEWCKNQGTEKMTPKELMEDFHKFRRKKTSEDWPCYNTFEAYEIMAAQADRIFELEEAWSAQKKWINVLDAELADYLASIAELEAALEQIADAYDKPTMSKDGLAFIARGALGEKE